MQMSLHMTLDNKNTISMTLKSDPLKKKHTLKEVPRTSLVA